MVLHPFRSRPPNECWQSGYAHYPLANATDTEIITWLVDHSRFASSITAHQPIEGFTVIDTAIRSVAKFGCPFSTLTDNGLVNTTRFSGGGNGGRNGFESVLVRLGVIQKNSRPNHPTTCGKVERFQQTMRNWLSAQPEQPTSLADLDTLFDEFRNECNQQRPHRSLGNRKPAAAYNSRPKAGPGPDGVERPHWRVRHDRVDTGGKILRTLTLDTTRTYQPTGRPPGGPKGPRNPKHPNP